MRSGKIFALDIFSGSNTHHREKYDVIFVQGCTNIEGIKCEIATSRILKLKIRVKLLRNERHTWSSILKPNKENQILMKKEFENITTTQSPVSSQGP